MGVVIYLMVLLALYFALYFVCHRTWLMLSGRLNRKMRFLHAAIENKQHRLLNSNTEEYQEYLMLMRQKMAGLWAGNEMLPNCYG